MTARRLAPLALLLALSGCGEEPKTTVFDLVAGLPLADVRSEVSRIDLGQPDSRWHLGAGWIAEGWDRRRTAAYVASDAREATLKIRAADRGPVSLVLSGRPMVELPSEPVAFEVLLNGRSLGSQVIERRTRDYRFRARRADLVPGTNEVTIRWNVDGADDPVPIVAWHELSLVRRNEVESLAPRRMADGVSMLIPSGSQLDYHLEIPAGAELSIGEAAFIGGAAGRFEVTLDEDGAESILLAELEAASTEGLRVDLGRFAGRTVRLSLEALPASGEVNRSMAVVLASPLIVAPPPAAAAHGPVPGPAGGQTVRGRNILLYVVDTLRADHLGIYGYPKPVSPRLDEFARRATVFERAIGQSSWTRASMASIHTGLWPLRHDTNGRRDLLVPEALTLAEILADGGYETNAIVGNHNVNRGFGFAQGFDNFVTLKQSRARRINQGVFEWLDSRQSEAPFFLWLQPVEPHAPYNPSKEHLDRLGDIDLSSLVGEPPRKGKEALWSTDEERDQVARQLLALYDGEIAANDVAFGELVDGLEERGLLDETLVVFVSDHGEEFLDHGDWEHGKNLFNETLQVPLVIRLPGQTEARRVDRVVQHIDLFATMLDFAGIAVPATAEGRSLLSLVEGGAGDAPVAAFSYLHLDGRPHLSMVDGDWKLIQRLVSSDGVETLLMRHSDDPGETRNRLLEFPIRARFMELRMAARRAEGRLLSSSEAVLDEETENALRALGYLQ